MGRKILMTFLKSVVLFNVMQIITPDDNCALHFLARNNTRQNTTSDAYISCKGALLVNVSSLNGLSREL